MICATKSPKNPSMNLTVTGNRVENNAKKSIYWVFDPMYALILIENSGFHRIFDDKI